MLRANKPVQLNHSGGKTAAVLLLALAAAVLLSSCRFLPLDGGSRPVYTLPESSFSETGTATGHTTRETTPSSQSDITTESASETASTTQPAATSATTARKNPDAGFDLLVQQLIAEGLAGQQREISLDPLLDEYLVDESMIDQAVEKIYDAYKKVYSLNPQYFYLSGSVKLNYYIQTGAEARMQNANLLPQYWPDYEQWSDSELAAVRESLEQTAASLAKQIEQASAIPWLRLLLLHDWLIREIAYASDGSQDINNIYGALIDKMTLCQGYAQAFQLVGQYMGFEIILISGQSGGIGHAWNLVSLDDVWYHIDVTHDDPVPDGGSGRPAQHIHFLRSDQIMSQTHIWEKENYPGAAKDGAHYYHHNDLVAFSREELTSALEQAVSSSDLDSGRKFVLEWLYTGSDMPDRAELEQILADTLEKYGIYQTLYYRVNAGKAIVLYEISYSEE